jgi:hypothetical protein
VKDRVTLQRPLLCAGNPGAQPNGITNMRGSGSHIDANLGGEIYFRNDSANHLNFFSLAF